MNNEKFNNSFLNYKLNSLQLGIGTVDETKAAVRTIINGYRRKNYIFFTIGIIAGATLMFLLLEVI